MKKNPNRVEKSDGSGIVFVWLRVCVCVCIVLPARMDKESQLQFEHFWWTRCHLLLLRPGSVVCLSGQWSTSVCLTVNNQTDDKAVGNIRRDTSACGARQSVNGWLPVGLLLPVGEVWPKGDVLCASTAVCTMHALGHRDIANGDFRWTRRERNWLIRTAKTSQPVYIAIDK